MLDNQSLNPNWQQAQQHAMATRPGKIALHVQNTSPYKTVLCPCCLNPIQKESISYCQNVKELDFLGFGFPLFYDFAINCIILLIVSVCSYNIMSLYTATQYNKKFCSKALLTQQSMASRQSNLSYASAEFVPFSSQNCFSFMLYFSHVQSQTTQEELVLRTTSFVLHILVLLYLRNKSRLLKEYYRQRSTLISNYSILIKGIPANLTGLKAKFDKFFNREFSDSPKIEQITFAPDLQKIEKLEIERSRLIERKKQILKKIGTQNSNATNQADQDKLRQKNLQLQLIKQKIYDECFELDKQIRMDVITSEKLIVTFNTQAERYWVRKQFKQLPKQRIQQYFGQQSKKMSFQNAPEPKQIIWQNFNQKSQSKFLRLIIGWALSIAFIISVTLLFYLLMNKKANIVSEYVKHKQGQQTETQGNLGMKAGFLVYFSLVCVILFNKFGMAFLLHKFSHIQRHQTTSDQEFSFALKYSLGLLFTTAFMTLAVEAITHKNYFTHQYGVVEEETIMFFLNSFFVPLIWLINPIWIIKRIKRKIQYQSPKLTQMQANQLMQDPSYEMGKRYAEILETLWFTFLYATLIPFGAVLSLIGICLYYLVDKYNLLSRSSVHGNISQKLSQYSTTLLEFTLFFRPMGQIIFDYHIRKNTSIHPISVVFLVIAIIYILLPWNFILKRCIKEKFNLSQSKFQDIRYKFTETYHTMHPIYRELYLKDHLNKRNFTMGLILPSGMEVQGIASDNRMIVPSQQ